MEVRAMSSIREMQLPSKVNHYSAATLPAQRLTVRSFGLGKPAGYDEASNGNRLYHKDPIFKAGTFKDSMGMQNTWEAAHLSQMVFHFDMLRDSGKLTGIPWRDGHPSIFGGGGAVVGWFQDVYVEDDFLYCDWLCTEPEAAEKYDRGTFGPRSAEVGFYESNDEAMYWPVLMGCAFVDIPAVEGLFTKERSMEQLSAFGVLPDSEIKERVLLFNGQQSANGGGTGGDGNGGGNGNQGGAGGGAPAQQQQSQPPANDPASTGGANEGTGGSASGEGGTSSHAAPSAHTFMVNGQPISDFGAVQNHINVLEQAQREQSEQARRDFVNELASSNRILATQVEGYTNHVLSLTPEQFEAFRQLNAVPEGQQVPPQALLAAHGGAGTVTNPNGEQPQGTTQLDTDKQIVAQHKRAGMKADKIRETPSFKRLATAGQAPPL